VLERSIVDQGAARRTDVHVVTAKRSPIDRASIGELAIDRGARRRDHATGRRRET
jgi:hypothetical protein